MGLFILFSEKILKHDRKIKQEKIMVHLGKNFLMKEVELIKEL